MAPVSELTFDAFGASPGPVEALFIHTTRAATTTSATTTPMLIQIANQLTLRCCF